MMDFETDACRASELITRLRKLIAEHGDLVICADDPDTDWRLPIGVVFKAGGGPKQWPDRFEIKTDYNGDPKGYVRPIVKPKHMFTDDAGNEIQGGVLKPEPGTGDEV